MHFNNYYSKQVRIKVILNILYYHFLIQDYHHYKYKQLRKEIILYNIINNKSYNIKLILIIYNTKQQNKKNMHNNNNNNYKYNYLNKKIN